MTYGKKKKKRLLAYSVRRRIDQDIREGMWKGYEN